MSSINSTEAKGDNALLALDNQLCFSLYACSRAMVQSYQPLLDKLGLTYPQYLAMLVLWQETARGSDDDLESKTEPKPESEPGVTVQHLGQRLLLDSGTLSPLLKRLEAKGLLERRRGLKDERQRMIQLTEAGLAMREAARCVPLEQFQRLGLPAEHLISLKQQLDVLLQQLQQIPPAP